MDIVKYDINYEAIRNSLESKYIFYKNIKLRPCLFQFEALNNVPYMFLILILAVDNLLYFRFFTSTICEIK